jgi:excinuclease ABC subunit B
MYADTETASMRACIGETTRRRAIQQAYNDEHGITPQSIIKQIDDVMSSVYERDYLTPAPMIGSGAERFRTQAELDAFIKQQEAAMKAAAANLDFEKAASLRDKIKRLRNPDLALDGGPKPGTMPSLTPRPPATPEGSDAA